MERAGGVVAGVGGFEGREKSRPNRGGEENKEETGPREGGECAEAVTQGSSGGEEDAGTGEIEAKQQHVGLLHRAAIHEREVGDDETTRPAGRSRAGCQWRGGGVGGRIRLADTEPAVEHPRCVAETEEGRMVDAVDEEADERRGEGDEGGGEEG